MPQYLVKPTNSVLVQGPHQIIEMKVGANATAAKMLPKRCVIYDAADGDVKEASVNTKVIGVLMEQPDQALTYAYAVADPARVVTKGLVMCDYASGAAGCTPGDLLIPTADGKVYVFSLCTDASLVIGKAMTTVAAAGPDTVIVELC